MTNINRRHLMRTLAASTVLASTVPSKGAQDTRIVAAAERNGERDAWRGAWLIARQNRQTSGHHIVDFWSKPFCEIHHADYLPVEIARGVLWHEYEGYASEQEAALKYVDAVFKQERSEWRTDPRQFVEHLGGTETLSSPLPILVRKSTAWCLGGRTALLALDSWAPSSTDPDWADMLPAFRCCYDRVIGHFHLDRRGFRHWKTCLTQDQFGPFGAGYFDRFFSQAAAQCDAVVFTSPSLVEHDYMRSPYASTEALVGQLMQQLGHALLDDNTLQQIVPIREDGIRNPPRAFALASVTCTVDQPFVQLSHLCRQRELITGSFGDRKYMRPMLIATFDSEVEILAGLISDQVLGTDFMFLRPTNSNRLRGGNPYEPLDLLTLWPFDAEID